MPILRALVLAALALTVLAVAAPAYARVWNVGAGRGDAPPCPTPDFLRIQDAIDAARPHDTIAVCPDSYSENLVFAGHRKSHISVVAVPGDFVWVTGDDRRPTITITGGVDHVRVSGLTVLDYSRGAVIEVGGRARDVVLSRMEMYCLGGGGVHVTGGAQATIDSASIGLVQDAWCWGVDVDGGARADVTGGYGTFGLRATGYGTRLRAVGNTLFGPPEPPSPMFNTALIRDGARATLRQNEFVGSTRTAPWVDESWKANSAVIRVQNTAGVVIGDQGRGSTSAGNLVAGGPSDGVVVQASRNVTVAGNTISGLFGRGLVVSADSRQNRILRNRLTGNLQFGTEAAPPDSTWFGPAEDFDCRDASTGHRTAGTANTWAGNTSDAGPLASLPAGLCTTP